MSDTKYAVGVDLGGQSLKLGLVGEDGQVLIRRQAIVERTRSADQIAHLVIDQVRHVCGQARDLGCPPEAVGMVMPGYMDQERSQLLLAANLPALSGSDVLATIRRGLELPVTFDADSNAAALGEYHHGAGRGVDRLVVAVVGTGIGAGVVIGGHILRVREHIAGSLGHVIVDGRGPDCACGARGCVEALASGTAMQRRAMEMAQAEPSSRLAALLAERGRLTGVEIGQALRENDGAARRVVGECGWWLGVGVASWSVIFKPDKVLIGGGVAALGEPFLNAVRDGFAQVAQPGLRQAVSIEPAALGADAGLIGAAALVMAG